jgi:hypothetical protein
MPPRSSTGYSLLLAAALAFLSYVPFPILAQTSWFICLFLFVFDPIPPISRVLALVTVCLVALLSKVYQRHMLQQEKEGEEDGEKADTDRLHNETHDKVDESEEAAAPISADDKKQL